MKISGNIDYSTLDVKRLYLNGLRGDAECNHCKNNITIYFDEHYPYSIKEDGSCQISFNCSECDESTDKEMKLFR